MNIMNFGPALSDEHIEDDAADMMIAPPDWRAMITEPMETNSLAPSDEALGFAFDLYSDEFLEPFAEQHAEMAAITADIVGGIADLQIIAPDLLDDVLSPDAPVSMPVPEDRRAA